MKGRALIVVSSAGEATRQALVRVGALRTDLAIVHDGAHLAFPVHDDAPLTGIEGVVEEREFPVRPVELPLSYRDLLRWPDAEKAELPRAFDVIGDVVLVRLPRGLEGRRDAIGEALLRFVPAARVVGWDRGVHGPERRRRVERIAGTGGWATRHRENGISFDVDLERAYFSPRLAREHARVAQEVSAGDRVYDLCCGVGPFSVTIARDGRAGPITAVDSNPAAIELLRCTLARYPFAQRVTPVEGRVEEFARSGSPVERVILNLPHEGIKYIPSVARLVVPSGRLYYYEVVPRSEFQGRAKVIEGSLGPDGDWAALPSRVVHPYSPGTDLASFVFERRKE